MAVEVLNLKYNDQRLCCSMLVDLALHEKFGTMVWAADGGYRRQLEVLKKPGSVAFLLGGICPPAHFLGLFG
jgi:hypothetical protein